MSLINITDLCFSYPGGAESVFENLNTALDTDWKTGLIGRNGKGKTTLMRLLCKQLVPDAGEISASVKFDYFPFETRAQSPTVYDALAEVLPDLELWRLQKELALTDTDAEILWRAPLTLSPGELVKVKLCALFSVNGNFLLIDEPTNHLDMFSRGILGGYLAKKRGFILASHDRAFLDLCVNRIVAFNRSGVRVQRGNFSSWYADMKQREESERAQNERLKRDIRRLEESAKRAESWADKVEKSKYGIDKGSGEAYDKGFIGHKAAKMNKRAKAIEKRANEAIDEKSALLKDAERADPLKIAPLAYAKPRLIEARKLSLYYGEKTVFENLTFEVNGGERVALTGRNGSGKTSLIKLILNNGQIENARTDGTLNIGGGLIVAYAPQNDENMRGSMAEYAREQNADGTLFFAILNKLGFDKSKFGDDLTALSRGQLKKVSLAALLAKRAHLYILDEPLNYVDVISRIQIEELFLTYKPTMLFVEHDRAFCEKIADKTIAL
ncbi:MAG: ATP-binding cassette domain-containing protein [Clostridiales bacterium]|jgi:lincosamide and streptogramin A transport system ATP-binding/permease protein|nr:ATP-binding cassette domain-containing protein [Clostridiales bacterium]